MLSLDELQNLARAHQAEERVISIMQSTIPKPKRPGPTPPVPMAPMTGKTVAATLASIDSHATRLFVILSECEKDAFGIIRIERAKLARQMGLGVSTVALATATLRRNGLLQRIGRVGYLLRTK